MDGGGDSSENIIVKNIYSALISIMDYPIWSGWKVNIWKWNIQLKIKLFIWMITENKVLTWDALQKKDGRDLGFAFSANTNLKILTIYSFIVPSQRQFGPD
jgi:hypothetical protein